MIGEILTNPLVIALIIGIATKVFGSIFKETKQETNKQSPSPKQPPKRENTKETHVSKESDISEEISSIRNQYGTLKEEMQARLNKTEINTIQTRRQPSEKTAKVNNVFKMNKSTVVQGFILGEVFGPPRSKNPHHTMKRRKKN